MRNAPLPPVGQRRNSHLSLRATEGSVAISMLWKNYEVASVVLLPRNDIMRHSLWGEGKGEGSLGVGG